MISFTRGLVLRKGERTIEFERDLGNGEVQFKCLDNFEIKTFGVAKIYKEILDGVVNVVRPAGGLTRRELPSEEPDIRPQRSTLRYTERRGVVVIFSCGME